MSEDPKPSADPEQPEGGFAEGQADPEKFPEEEHVGRFSEGQEELGEEDPEKHQRVGSAKARRSSARRIPRSMSRAASATAEDAG